jgi:hypothetical protein
VTGVWSRQATIGVATALMAQIGPDLFVGTEARYAKLSERSWILLAWNVQIAGRSDPVPLDFRNLERHQAIKFGFTF